jgi:hypothetical protein
LQSLSPALSISLFDLFFPTLQRVFAIFIEFLILGVKLQVKFFSFLIQVSLLPILGSLSVFFALLHAFKGEFFLLILALVFFTLQGAFPLLLVHV